MLQDYNSNTTHTVTKISYDLDIYCKLCVDNEDLSSIHCISALVSNTFLPPDDKLFEEDNRCRFGFLQELKSWNIENDIGIIHVIDIT